MPPPSDVETAASFPRRLHPRIELHNFHDVRLPPKHGNLFDIFHVDGGQ